MRQWRALVYFDALTDFNLGTILRADQATLMAANFNGRSPIKYPRLPGVFYMQVNIFSQTFTLEIPVPRLDHKEKHEDFTACAKAARGIWSVKEDYEETEVADYRKFKIEMDPMAELLR